MKTLWFKICGTIVLGVAILMVVLVCVFHSSDQQRQSVIESTESERQAAVSPAVEQESEKKAEKLYKMAVENFGSTNTFIKKPGEGFLI